MGQLERVPGVQNWIERLPAPMRAAWNRSIIYRAAVHMAEPRGSMPVGVAIASAINWAEHICKTGDVKQWRGPQQVKPSSREECCAAVALWNTMKATSKAKTAAKNLSRGDDPLFVIDLARRYIASRDGLSTHLPHGATSAFLDLSVVR